VATGSLLGAERQEATYADFSGDQLDFVIKRRTGFGQAGKLALSFPGGDRLSWISGVNDPVVAELSAWKLHGTSNDKPTRSFVMLAM
jgi:hypothetical protein